jgi:hypothetical protein
MYFFIARDRDGSLFLYNDKPIRQSDYGTWTSCDFFKMDDKLFPEITWQDEPQQVTVKIEKH